MPVACMPAVSQTIFPLTFVLVELTTVVVHSFASAIFNLSLSKSSLVTQCFSVSVLVCPPEFAFILSSILARCSGVNRFSNSVGIPISPVLLIVRVLSQRPGLIFRDCSLIVDCADFRVWAQAALAAITVSGKTKPTNPNNIVTNFFTVLLLRQNWSHSNAGQNASKRAKGQMKRKLNRSDMTNL